MAIGTIGAIDTVGFGRILFNGRHSFKKVSSSRQNDDDGDEDFLVKSSTLIENRYRCSDQMEKV